MAKLTEWQCPKTDHQPSVVTATHPEDREVISADPTLAADGTVASVILLDPPPPTGWHCFFCGGPLERVKELPIATHAPPVVDPEPPKIDLEKIPYEAGAKLFE